ncbi:MAG: hypothetical protein OEZ34_01205 [Spirochaetia bacterium]|nr:hypothetical protein [Spirochaetia bacterium]
MQYHAHTLLTSLYPGKTFRFSLYPENYENFSDLPFIDPSVSFEKITVHKDAQGMIIARKKDYRFVMDPPTGNFKLNGSRGEILSGIIYGEFASNSIYLRINQEDSIFGFGASSGSYHHADKKFRLMNLDTVLYSIPGSSYSSFPFFIIKRGNTYNGIFLASSIPMDIHIDSKGINPGGSGIYINFDARIDKIPVNVFVFQGSPGEILEKYNMITGFPCRLPVWALGFHQSRWSYKSQKAVIETAKKFRDFDIPCDAIHLDIDYMDQYRNFTWNRNQFPSPDQMNRQLAEYGFRSVCIVDAGIPKDQEFFIYKEGHDQGMFCKTSGGEDYTGTVWKKTVYPDFTDEKVQEWFSKKHQILFENGVSGIWNDMNDPVLKLGKNYDPLNENIVHRKGSHIEFRNLYANFQALSTVKAFDLYKPDERPFILTRSGFPGIQKCAALWTGDNHSTWNHLKENLNMVINLGLSGMPFIGADTGGFASGPGKMGLINIRKNKELFVRWIELGSLMPFFRVHSVKFSRGREPWKFDDQILSISRKLIKRRYRLMHYIYNLMLESHQAGLPIVRPVFFEFPGIDAAKCEEMFMLGPSLLAVPVMKKGVRNISFYLPEGQWTEFETGRIYSGDSTYELETEPGYFPLFIKGGSILPLCRPEPNAEQSLRSSLIIEIHPAKKMDSSLVLDDGISRSLDHFILHFSAEKDTSKKIKVQIDTDKNGYMPDFKTMKIRLPAKYKNMASENKKIEGMAADLTSEDRFFSMTEWEVPLKNQTLVFSCNK